MRQKSAKYIFLFVFCFFAFLDRAYSVCLLSWSGAGQALTVPVVQNYNPLSIQITRADASNANGNCTGNPTNFYFYIRNVENNGTNPKYLYLNGATNTPGLPIVFYKSDNSSIISSNNPISGSVNNQGTSITYSAYINPADVQTMAQGNYSGEFRICLALSANGAVNEQSCVKYQPITFTFYVQPQAPTLDIALLPSGTTTFNINATSYTLDFPILSEGAEKDFNIAIQYNTKYKIGFKSPTNLGKLKNSLGTAIDYQMNVNNTGYFSLNIENFPAATTNSTVPTNQPTATTSFNVKVRINNVAGNVVGKPSGYYSDNVTITISAL